MKKRIYIILAAAFLLLGAKAIKDNTLVIGNASNSDKEIVFDIGADTANPRFLWDSTSNTLKFTNDNSEILEIGSGSGGGGGGINVIEEGGFEREAATTLWTNAGSGTFVRTTTAANIGNGDAGGEWNPAAASDTLTSSTVLVPNQIADTLCIAEMFYKGGGTANITMQVLDGSNVLVPQSDTVITDAAATFKRAYTTFICPTVGESVKFQLLAAGDAAVIYVDDVHVGVKGLTRGAAGGWKIYDEDDIGIINTTPTGFSLVKAFYQPYKDPVTGGWRMRFNLDATMTSAVSGSLALTGVSAIGVTACATVSNSVTVASRAIFSGANQLQVLHASSNAGFWATCDLPLDSKPTWADFDGTVNLLNNSVIYSNERFIAKGLASGLFAVADDTAVTVNDWLNTYSDPNFNGTAYTIPADGWYTVSAAVQWSVADLATTEGRIFIQNDGITIEENRIDGQGMTNPSQKASITDKFEAGDLVTIVVKQKSGVSKDVSDNVVHTMFNVKREADISSESPLGFGEADADNAGLVTKKLFSVYGQWRSTCTVSPCTSFTSNGDVDVTNVTRTGTGVYRINFATPWLATDQYACTVNNLLGSNDYCTSSTGGTADYWVLNCFDDTGTAFDTRASFVCMGDSY